MVKFHPSTKARRISENRSPLRVVPVPKSGLEYYFKSLDLTPPKCFSLSKSKLSQKLSNSLVEFYKYLMRSGKLSKAVIMLAKSFAAPSLVFPVSNTGNKLRQLLFSNLHAYVGTRQRENFEINRNLKVGVDYVDSAHEFFAIASSLKPLFHFYIYRVNKKIYKNSRGKSGKYTFIWKYVPKFNRLRFIFSQLASELRFDGLKSLKLRTVSTLCKYLTEVDKTLISRSIRFSNNYVFFSKRKSLLSTFRTVK